MTRTKPHRVTFDDVNNHIAWLEVCRMPTDNQGDRIEPKGYVYGWDLRQLQCEAEWLDEQEPDDCGRCEHGFTCPTTEENVFTQAHWETLGRIDRRAIAYLWDRLANVVYRITQQADWDEVKALAERLIEREFPKEQT